MGPDPDGLIRVGVEARALAGAPESGDQCCVESSEDGTLVAVVDGIGHGLPAAADARVVIDEVKARRPRESLSHLALRCHRRLREMRGAVIGLAHFPADAARLEWLGVGNVHGLLFRRGSAIRALVSGRGVLGQGTPELLPQSVPLEAGDVLVVTTDGVDGGFASDVLRGEPQALAGRILSRFATRDDDALVLVARYEGGRRTLGTVLA